MKGQIKSLLAYYIRSLRQMRGLTQQDIADKLHKTTNAVSNWELGNTSPPVDDLVQLCEIFDVTPSQILGWDECPELTEYIAKSEDAAQRVEELKRQKKEIEEQIQSYISMMSPKKS